MTLFVSLSNQNPTNPITMHKKITIVASIVVLYVKFNVVLTKSVFINYHSVFNEKTVYGYPQKTVPDYREPFFLLTFL